jgi:wobble nucleotide-excising tRNase
MTITRIRRLRECGVFRDFTWPADLPNFGRYNLIYGWNGSGKTTLSRLCRALETGTAPPAGQVTLSINEKDVDGDGFAQATLPVRVFNRDFVTESVFPVGGDDVPRIFVVGKESVEKQREVEQLKRDLAKAQTELESERSKKQNADRAFDKFCIDRATVIRDTLRSPGSNPYNNHNKSDFLDRAKKMATAGDRDVHRLSDADREKLLVQHIATPKPKLNLVSYQLPALKSLEDTASQLLSTTVISRTIQSLKEDPSLSAWMHQGLGLHQKRHAERCLFCEQALPKNRLASLEAHFSSEYEQFLNRLDAQGAQLKELSTAAATLALPNRAEFYDDLGVEYAAAERSLRQAVNSTRTFLDSLVQVLTDKRSQAFESVRLDVPVPEVDSSNVDRLNEVIRKHNQACDVFQERITRARQRLEADSVARNLDEFLTLREAVRTAAQLVTGAEARGKGLNEDITRLERKIVEHQQPAEELNEDLRKYLDHDELRLEIKDTGYTITRNGVPAQALSEGETTAVALLYFLKSLQDRRFDLTKGVIVLDDPVSSLDANALYLAFGFIRERTQDAAQLFILTHNFTFFRQVRNWFHHLKGKKKKEARFYMLDCAHDGDHRYASIRRLDPLLEQYDSEYHYLFARIHRVAKASAQVDLEQNYMLPNMARRLLEAFLAFRKPQVSGELSHKFKEVEFDEAKKLRILRFLHTHSHSDTIGEPEHDPSLLGEARSVLTDLLDLIQSQDPDHFSAMEKLVVPPTNEEGDE